MRVAILVKEKQLRALPHHVLVALLAWADAVQAYGLEKVRMLVGYHDEPLKGKLRGLRSVRLNRGYRAVYRVVDDHVCVEVIEVGKNVYRH